LKVQQVQAEKAAWSVFGKPLEDMMSLIKLQSLMVETSTPIANFVVPFHQTQGVEGLTALKVIKNAKL